MRGLALRRPYSRSIALSVSSLPAHDYTPLADDNNSYQVLQSRGADALRRLASA